MLVSTGSVMELLAATAAAAASTTTTTNMMFFQGQLIWERGEGARFAGRIMHMYFLETMQHSCYWEGLICWNC